MKTSGNRHNEAKKRKGAPADEFPASEKREGKYKIIQNGPFKGMKILPPVTKGVDSILHVSVPFMKNIFGLEPDEYMISDESRLSDFTDFGSGDVAPIIKKIRKMYGIDVTDAYRGNLLEIFRRIEPVARRDVENLLAESHRQARRAGLKRSDIAAAIREVRSRRK